MYALYGQIPTVYDLKTIQITAKVQLFPCELFIMDGSNFYVGERYP